MTTRNTAKPAAAKATAAKTPAVEAPAEMGWFATLEAEAMEDVNVHEPLVINEVTPPIVITDPVETDRVVAMAILYSRTKGGKDVNPAEFHPMLRSLCGDAYDRVWNELLRGKHFKVANAFMLYVLNYFMPEGPAAGKGGAEAVPGGSAA